ncbi:MAG: hypothetical protein KAJ75_09460, partial [Alphaproteobacteria bacterium]|nr:hypothetical protein [Alphaproteobacteria bacterium]
IAKANNKGINRMFFLFATVLFQSQLKIMFILNELVKRCVMGKYTLQKGTWQEQKNIINRRCVEAKL